ncbi:MAG: S41 family peptidase [Alphaproteobacteria bacterium]
MKRLMPGVVTAVAGGVVLGFIAGAVVPTVFAAEDSKSDTYRMLELFGDVFERVRSDYVENVSDEELIEAAVEGMLTHLDPHSTFLNKAKFRDMQVQTKGEFGGLGIEVTMEKGYVKVVSPIDETPAARAGIQAGDLITHLNTEPVQGMSLSEAVEKMRGPVKTDIVLTIRRGNQAAFDVTITRDKIRIQSVRSRAEGKIGYLRITSFSEQTDKGLKRAIERLKKEMGDDIAGYILDLRNNPGGLLDQAVTVSDSFLEQGEIVSTRGRKEDSGQRFYATAGDLIDGKPLVVMINGGSASASEIVAGALQDHRRAILLGTKSFGKGSVQTIIPLGRSGAIKLTTQRYYTPSGHSIQAKGIDPDIMVQQAKVEALDSVQPGRSERDLRGSLRNEEDGDPSAVTPDKEGEQKKPDEQKKDGTQKKPDQPGAGVKKDGKDDATPETDETAKKDPQAEDYQLARAIDLLRGIALYKGRMVN